jgi:hypothetical protein
MLHRAIAMNAYSDGVLNTSRVTKDCINDVVNVMASRRRSEAVDNYLYTLVLDKRHG